MTFFLADEVAKLQQHLQLLKEQYVRLQQRHSDLEQKYTQAVASSGSVGPHHFVTKLVGMVTGLYDKQLYRYEPGWCVVWGAFIWQQWEKLPLYRKHGLYNVIF